MGCGTSKTTVLREKPEILPDAIAFAEQDANAEAHALQTQEKAEIASRSTHEAAEFHGKDGHGTSHRSSSGKPLSEEKISKVSLDEAQKLAIDAVEQIWDDLLLEDAKQAHMSVWLPTMQAQRSSWTSTPAYDEVADVLRWPYGCATAVLTRTMVETANSMWERGEENAPSDVAECYVLEDAKVHLEAYKGLLADPTEVNLWRMSSVQTEHPIPGSGIGIIVNMQAARMLKR